jgi:hypothetical protein
MPEEKHIFDLSRCPHPMSEEFVLMDDDLFYECDKYQEYTQRATAAGSGQKNNSTIPCQHITEEGNHCNGTVQLKRLDVPKEIHWKCQKCGDHGAVINFEDTYWDLSHLSAEEKEQFLNQQYDDLWTDNPLDAELDSIFEEMDDNELEELAKLPFHQLYPQFFEEVIGLSEHAFARLFSSDWKQPGAPLYIRDDISFKEASQSLFFYNARSFLQLLAEQGSFTATQAGNLKRKTVEELTVACRWPDGYLEKIHEYNKVINEKDVWLLHKIRVLLDLAGLIQEKKGAFLPVKKRLHLADKEHAGKLFQLLFCTYFIKMNMAYRASSFAEYLQDGLPYSFYRLHQQSAEWASPENLYELMLLPADRMEIESGLDSSGYNPGISTLEYSLLKPLAQFGILEKRQTGKTDLFGLKKNSEFRKTPLFDKVIEFNIQ